MKATLTAVIAAIEAAAVALAVFAVLAVAALLLWWLSFDLAAEPFEVLSIVAALWQFVHLLPMQVEVSTEMALGLGVGAEPLSFTLSLAPAGLTLVTALLAFRSGWRFAGRGSIGAGALIGGTLGFAVAAGAVHTIASSEHDWWQALLVPSLVYACPLAVAFVVRAGTEQQEWWLAAVRQVQRTISSFAPRLSASLPERVGEALRVALAGFVALLGLSGLGVAASIVLGYVDIVALSQSLQLDALSALLLFLLQLVLLPIFWVWGIAWFAGSGFAIGTATSVSPFETLLGPLPALPILGALPQGWGLAGGIAPALVVALSALVGALAAGRPVLRRASVLAGTVIICTAAALIGLTVVLCAVLASGSIGPGRLAETGPAPWVTGGLIALQFAVGGCLGLYARRIDVARLREVMPVPAFADSSAPAQQEHAVRAPAGREHVEAEHAERVPAERVSEERQVAAKRSAPWWRLRRGADRGADRGITGGDASSNPSPLDSLDFDVRSIIQRARPEARGHGESASSTENAGSTESAHNTGRAGNSGTAESAENAETSVFGDLARDSRADNEPSNERPREQ